MKPLGLLFFPLIVAMASAHAQPMTKCTDPKTGKITFTDKLCPSAQYSEKIDVPPATVFDGSHLRQRAAQDRAAELAGESGPPGAVPGDSGQSSGGNASCRSALNANYGPGGPAACWDANAADG